MTRRLTYFTHTMFTTACFVLGCSGGGAAGCGNNSSSEDAPTIDSNLPAIYDITRYQGSREGCDEAHDIELPFSSLVFYPFRPDPEASETRLGATFCNRLEECRGLAELAFEPARGYSFIEGEDQAGWTGWAVLNSGPLNDQCRADVQTHRLTVSEGGTISIETTTVEVSFEPDLDDRNATCPNSEAIAESRGDLPCEEIILLQATRQTEL